MIVQRRIYSVIDNNTGEEKYFSAIGDELLYDYEQREFGARERKAKLRAKKAADAALASQNKAEKLKRRAKIASIEGNTAEAERLAKKAAEKEINAKGAASFAAKNVEDITAVRSKANVNVISDSMLGKGKRYKGGRNSINKAPSMSKQLQAVNARVNAENQLGNTKINKVFARDNNGKNIGTMTFNGVGQKAKSIEGTYTPNQRVTNIQKHKRRVVKGQVAPQKLVVGENSGIKFTVTPPVEKPLNGSTLGIVSNPEVKSSSKSGNVFKRTNSYKTGGGSSTVVKTSTPSKGIKLGKYGKAGLIGAGALGLGYAGKKAYDHYKEDK